jgi:N-ethylmaleimide reductase
MVMQIAHNGRNSHSSLMADGVGPVAPSAIAPTIPALTKDFQQVPAETPRPLETSEIAVIISAFRQAALNAMEAGFDGVELQGANSHLIEQFLENGTNRLEIVSAVTAAIGVDRLGVRLSPFGQYGGIHDSNPLELFTFVIGELSKRRIAYLHLIEARGSEIGLTDELHENAPNNAAVPFGF